MWDYIVILQIKLNVFSFALTSSGMKNIGLSMSGVIFIQLFSCVLFAATALLSLDQFEQIDRDLLFNFNNFFNSSVIGFIYCYFSEKITNISFGIGEIVYISSWYAMPFKQQKTIVMMIRDAQVEFRLNGLGIIDCSLSTFLAVIFHFWIFFAFWIKFNMGEIVVFTDWTGLGIILFDLTQNVRE